MEKRVFKRIPAFLSATLFYDDFFYDIRIINLSQNGIFFISNEYLSSGLNIEIYIPLKNTALKVPFKIVRISEIIDNMHFRFGAEILSPSQEYLKFIKGRVALQIQNILR